MGEGGYFLNYGKKNKQTKTKNTYHEIHALNKWFGVPGSGVNNRHNVVEQVSGTLPSKTRCPSNSSQSPIASLFSS